MNRRRFLASMLVTAVNPMPSAMAALDPTAPVVGGDLNAAELGMNPGASADQSRILQRLLDAASASNHQIYLPAGSYAVSEVKLPPRTRLAGVPGATRLVFAGGASMFTAERAEVIQLSGLTVDGADLPLDEYVPGIVHLADCRGVDISGCTFVGSSRSGLALDRCEGRIRSNAVTTARDAAIRAVESTGLSIVDNTIADCGNAGIQVYRWTAGPDGTLVSGNRIERIAAKAGGTGQNGNGINVFRAHDVIVSNNRLAQCAFTAIRANSANNVEIIGNNCADSGEVGIYSEFSFEGAMIANNIVDGAATGISVVNFNNGGHLAVVNGNIVRNITGVGPYKADPPGFGVGIAIEADTSASGNVIDGAPRFGMLLGWGPYLRDVAATGNVIRRAPVGVAVSVVEGAGSAIITDNLIAGAAQGAVVGMRWAETASGDLARGGAGQFPHLLVERNRVT
jgi:uncharacterized secreted repeat protein (TIGR03808 family)